MATGGQVNLGEKLICSICQEDVNIPKTLPCLHTFCERCIADFIVNTERQSGQKLSNYSCPVCRAVVTPLDPEADVRKWVDELKHEESPNLMMNVRNNKIEKHQECHVCKRLHKATRALNWCRECQEALCDTCTKNHGVMKLLTNHNVVEIDEAMNISNLTEDITESCPLHETKVVEFYCFDHDELCCVLCCTVNHRKCTDVRAVVDIIKDTKVGVVVFKSDLQKFSVSTRSLFESIKEEKSQNEKSLKDIENSVRSTVKTIKDNVDSLLIVFVKELHLKLDEMEISTDSDLRKVEDVLWVISEAESNFRSVQKYGTVVQLFVYLNKMRSDLGRAIESLITDLNIKGKKVNFVLNDILVRSLSLGGLGNLEETMPERQFTVDFLSKFSAASIDNVKVKRVKTIFLSGHDIRGGICIDENYIIVCGHFGGKLHIVDVSAASVISSVSVSTNQHLKRLSLDKKRNMLFISGYSGYFYKAEIQHDHQSFGQSHQIKNEMPYVGGVCLHNESVYVVVGSEIQKLDINKGVQFESCFGVDTNCTDLNGLAIDNKNKRLIYTSRTFQVIAVSLEGKEIFCYKDDEMKHVTSVAIDSKGLIFAGDESGCVHLISEDGKQRKILIEKCEKILKVCDVWLDNDKKRLFVCGNECIEIYSLGY